MNEFIQRHRAEVIGALSGFDRLRIRGTLRLLSYVEGMLMYLGLAKVLLKDFKAYALASTDQIRRATEQLALAAGRPLHYLPSSRESKEAWARAVAERDGVREGLIGVLSCVEPCRSYEIHRNRQAKRLELRGGPSKCLHYYFYLIHPRWGFMHLRLQTWFPFTVQVCLNGREWLGRQMDAAGLGYLRRENCFVQVEDAVRAQKLLDRQLRMHWPRELDRLLAQIHPSHGRIFRAEPVSYYWSVDQSEWATDVLFRSPGALARLYPQLIQHGITHLGSREVMRFLGRKLPAHGGVDGRFAGEVVTDLRERPEGVRIKHRVGANAIKMYDKQGSVLRIETTLNDTRDFKVYRAKEGDEDGPRSWRILRKGLADLHRRAEVCEQANDRYLSSLATVEDPTPLGQLTETLCRPVTWKGRRVRALNPLSAEDARLLEVVSRGEFAVHGFRNRDVRPLLFGSTEDATRERRHAAATTRRLRLLRAHGLIQKVSKTHRYVLSPKGRTAITATLAARTANTAELMRAA